MPYKTTWKALWDAKREILSDEEKSIQKLGRYLSKLAAVNERTLFKFEKQGNVFHRALLVPVVAAINFKNLLPIVEVDACHMKTRHGGMIFAATRITGAKNIFPLAIAVAPTENEDNWSWFLTSLVQAIPEINNPDVIVMSDRDKGLKGAQLNVIPRARPSICLKHLQRNVRARFKRDFNDLISAAAHAGTEDEYLEHMLDIKRTHQIVGSRFMTTWSGVERIGQLYSIQFHDSTFTLLT